MSRRVEGAAEMRQAARAQNRRAAFRHFARLETLQIMEPDPIPPTPSGSDDRAARAFARVGWTKLLAELYRYARDTLRLAAIDAERKGLVEAMEVVNILAEASLGGTLPWDQPEDATGEQIIGLACKKLDGVCWTLYRRAARTCYDDALEERPDLGKDALARLIEERGLSDLESALRHDADATVYLEEMLAGRKRAQIASRLGWDAQRAKVVRNRIVRRVRALYAATNDDNSEDEPPSSGPRGSCHVQTTEERPRTHPEPHRGALGAGRRR
jgi:hypothetical protein